MDLALLLGLRSNETIFHWKIRHGEEAATAVGKTKSNKVAGVEGPV